MALSILKRAELRDKFEDGDTPNQEDFHNWIESFVHRSEDGITVDNGNIGIGIANPSMSLEVTKPSLWNAPAIGLSWKSGEVEKWNYLHLGLGPHDHSLIWDNKCAMRFGIESKKGNGYKELMRITKDGNIGVGELKPGAKLSFGKHYANTTLALWEDSDTKKRYGFGIQSLQLRIHVDSPDARFSFLNGEEGSEIFTIKGNGNVGIGTKDPTRKLSVNGDVEINGNLIVNGMAFKSSLDYRPIVIDRPFVYTDTDWDEGVPGGSDFRLKKDIQTFYDSLNLLKQVKPVKFKYNGKGGIPESEEKIGIIAQEIQPLFPYMVFPQKRKLDETDAEETELLFFDGSALIYVAINAIKELNAKIEQLESKLKSSVSIA